MTARFFVPGYGTDPAQLGPGMPLQPYGIHPAAQPESGLSIDVGKAEGVGLEPTSVCTRRFSRPVP